MSHLAEEYAKACGVKIGKPIFKPHYFPIIHEKYITIHNDKKVQAKEYDFWPEVISILRPFIEDIKIIQVGNFGEATIEGVDAHLPTASLKQCCYIIKNSLGHMGIDSVPVHIASACDRPVVGIYAHTYANTCSPLWNEKSKAITIESDRGGRSPSFSLEENPKTINFIKSEEIAKAMLDVLGIDKKINRKTLFQGPRSMVNCIEVIPSENPSFQGGPVLVRMDLFHNEKVLNHTLNISPCEVTLTRPINESFLKSGRINRLTYKSNDFDPRFLKQIKNSGIPSTFVCSSQKALDRERYKNFDTLIHLEKDQKVIAENRKKVKIDDFKSIKIKSRKKVLRGNQVYDSTFDMDGRKKINDFYIDLDWFLVYTDTDE